MTYKIRWLKDYKERKVGDISEAASQSAKNFVEMGYAEFVQSDQKGGLLQEKGVVTSSVTNSVTNISEKEKGELFGNNTPEFVTTYIPENISQGGLMRKTPVELPVTSVTNDTSVTSVTSVTNTEEKVNVTNVTSVTHLSQKLSSDNYTEILGASTLSKIFYCLANSDKPLSYQEISDLTKENPINIRVTIHRHTEYFSETEKVEGKKSFQLSDLGINYINLAVDNFDKKREGFVESMKEKQSALRNSEVLESEVRAIVDSLKPEVSSGVLIISFNNILEHNPALADRLLDNPDEVIGFFEATPLVEMNHLSVRIKDLPESQVKCVYQIRKDHIGKLLCVEGRVVSLSTVRPVIKSAKFECPTCGTMITIVQQENLFREPRRCSCGRRGGFKILSKELADCSNLMLEDLQEKTEDPDLKRVKARIENDLTTTENIKTFTPGNEIRAVGILRETKNYSRGSQTNELGLYLEILYAEMFEPEIMPEEFSEEDKERITTLASKIDTVGFSEINSSFAPEIHGCDEIKNAIILQLCSRRNEAKSSTVRSKPNILLIGDPGVAKSVLGDFAVSITPGSRSAAGGGSSAVGITASVVKEDESLGGYRVEPGALVLAKELLFLDELNNLPDDDKPKLQEGMNQQKVTINKANLHVALKVTAGVLAAANPKMGTFDKFNPNVVEQFNIPAPIVNRFDAIFVIKDVPKDERDKAIAHVMIQRQRKQVKSSYDIDFLRKFFVHIRNQPEPTIDDEVGEQLKTLYVKERKYKTEMINVNPRFLESLLRLVTASAKLRLSTKVESRDIQRAIKIMSESHYGTREFLEISKVEVKK